MDLEPLGHDPFHLPAIIGIPAGTIKGQQRGNLAAMEDPALQGRRIVHLQIDPVRNLQTTRRQKPHPTQTQILDNCPTYGASETEQGNLHQGRDTTALLGKWRLAIMAPPPSWAPSAFRPEVLRPDLSNSLPLSLARRAVSADKGKRCSSRSTDES